MERLQKIVSRAGLCSRREAEKWILAGRVAVNGEKIIKLGTKADPKKDRITVDGKRVYLNRRKVYYLFHKPRRVMVTRSDPEGRPTLYRYLKKIKERVFVVGRLDYDSEGLLLLTNDGAFTHRLTDPRSKVAKIYEVKIHGKPTEETLQKITKGIRLAWGKTEPVKINLMKKLDKNCWLKMKLTEGKNRQIRRMLEKCGYDVLRLKRIAIGPYKLGDLKPGRLKAVQRN